MISDASPFREQYEWGAITEKENTLYLILSGKYSCTAKLS